jgi:hypothetical protein
MSGVANRPLVKMLEGSMRSSSRSPRSFSGHTALAVQDARFQQLSCDFNSTGAVQVLFNITYRLFEPPF